MGSEHSEGNSGFYLPAYNDEASVSQQDLLDAMRGEFIPTKLDNISRRDTIRTIACIVHGLRYNESYAESESMEEICAKSTNKVFARARNARLIMSNKIPLMTNDEEKPYCIWHPQVASVNTYSELARRYPDMRYHVGRACAVAGYVDLYRELDLLPDISVAEEARDNMGSVGSKEIFDLIMRQPILYNVMDDYTRSVNWKGPRIATGLNGDTAVLSSLDVTIEVWKQWPKERFHYFNITEDHNVGETSSPRTHSRPLDPEHVPLFYNPLPLHLPTTNKDALIVHAAYEGNIDRYARLRRPVMISSVEGKAVVRGIYHHTAFARWLVSQPLSFFKHLEYDIKEAIMARFIMINDLSRITDVTTTMTSANAKDDWPMPFMIWWPLLPEEATLRELWRRRDDMRLEVAITCIVADYRHLWDELKPEPHAFLWEQATQRQNGTSTANRNYFVEDLERRAAEKGINLRDPVQLRREDLSECLRRIKEPTSIFLQPNISIDNGVRGDTQLDGIYPGGQVHLGHWELCLAVSDDVREKARTENVDNCLNENWGWPYSSWDVWASINHKFHPDEERDDDAKTTDT